MRTPSISALLFPLLIIAASLLTAACSSATPARSNPLPEKQALKSDPPPDTKLASWRAPDSRKPRFLFIHHSTGSGFLDEGGMRQKLQDAGFDVHDRTYGDGWVGDHTDPPDFPVTFTQHYDDMISWDLGQGEKYDIVAFKSCFPASNICSDDQLSQYKSYYETIKTVTQKHPETLFIAFSTPPLVPGATKSECAARAREFSIWLLDWAKNQSNIRVYDLFNVLAESDTSKPDVNELKRDYRRNESDSHPNALANKTVADDFTKWLSGIVKID